MKQTEKIISRGKARIEAGRGESQEGRRVRLVGRDDIGGNIRVDGCGGEGGVQKRYLAVAGT